MYWQGRRSALRWLGLRALRVFLCCAASLRTCVRGALAEERGADANTRCALFDGEREVTAHAHGEDFEIQLWMMGSPAVAPRAQATKTCACDVLGNTLRRDGHEAAGFEVG